MFDTVNLINRSIMLKLDPNDGLRGYYFGGPTIKLEFSFEHFIVILDAAPLTCRDAH